MPSGTRQPAYPAAPNQVTPPNQPPSLPPPGQPPPLPPGPPPRRAPRWLTWLGKKVLGWLIFVLLTVLALAWAYDHFFGSDGGGPTGTEGGGGRMETNNLMANDPYVQVRYIYTDIAQGKPDMVCDRFDPRARQQFARNMMGLDDCHQVAMALHERVEAGKATEYASSVGFNTPSALAPSVAAMAPGDTITIDSCEHAVEGGPALGVFVLTKLGHKNQWLVTEHRPGPTECPNASGPSPTSPGR
ncbi:hypothetical protein SAMN05421810_11172 [Amycolatopsis arida]|uniref:Uncharacterized protein n=1 Tax=Amycolatopsis arida TaxID=587909 RepID=A0A1I6A4M0_9PSEU|nr:hypothetical protein [Amycolatopsis arida]TDX88619.1 hypothetical protein CLV69_111141 [Amycolatopsis arida]SFQ63618.1 hypothetical protein SAMN05421810_11172 [Amycolatopsis arida]